jgi:hypothetical protein
VILLVLVAFMAPALVAAACGGSDEPPVAGTAFPVFAGAMRLDFATLRRSDLGFGAREYGSVLYASSAEFAVVADYYRGAVTREGWIIERSMTIVEGADVVAVLSKDQQVVGVDVLTVDAARQQPELFAQADVELDLDDMGAIETVILLLYFTCAEAETAVCVRGLTGQ